MKPKKSTATSKLADLVKGVAAKITKTAAKAVPRRSAAKKTAKAKAEPQKEKAAAKPAPKPRKFARTVLPTAKPAAATPKKAARKTTRKPVAKDVELPAILFEGDHPSLPPAGGPGQRYALGPTAPKEDFTDEAELPEAYGTKDILLAARDPHWLYAHWDLTRDQLRRFNAMSRDGHLIVRVFLGNPTGTPIQEVHVHPESRHWFIHVERAGARYAVELGYYGTNKRWKSISTSGLTLTPPDMMADDASELFATIPMEVPLPKLVELVQSAAAESAPLAAAIEELRISGHPQLPPQLALAASTAEGAPVKPLSPAQKRAIAEIITLDQVRRVWIGSLEITELLRRQIERGEVESLSSAALAAAQSSALSSLSSLSSPFGGTAAARPKGFWFNVNAELIIYGATEPDASVTIGGRKIRLRPDGSFSYRFALPDGDYELPATAVSADASDARHATLQFRRATQYFGDVGTHPQDAALKKPSPDNV